jgi:hypothetical protein
MRGMAAWNIFQRLRLYFLSESCSVYYRLSPRRASISKGALPLRSIALSSRAAKSSFERTAVFHFFLSLKNGMFICLIVESVEGVEA